MSFYKKCNFREIGGKLVNLNHVLIYTVFVLFCMLYFGAILYRTIIEPAVPVVEYGSHIRFAIDMYQKKRATVPHFLFHLLTIIHYNSLLCFSGEKIASMTSENINWKLAAFFVMLEVYIGIAIFLFIYYKNIFYGKFKSYVVIACIVSFSISICTPIFLLAPIDGLYYLGYITPSTIYIIPTQNLLKLPALALFLLTYSCYYVEHNSFLKIYVLSPLLVILSGLAKPNWLLVMIPALIVISLIRINKKHYINWQSLLVTFLSSFAVLGWQYYFKFIDPYSSIYKSNIVITSPFEAWGSHSDFIFIKILLSILFPLYVSAIFWNEMKENFTIKYGWLVFLIGMIYTGFFGESGALRASNFVWCGQIACFMLFVSSASFFFSECAISHRMMYRKIIGIIFFCAHVVCGLIYYFRTFNLYSYT